MDLLSLPVVMIEHILSYLSYDEIARNRVVCKLFNELSMRMLNRGFLMIERRHAQTLKSVKTQLPRRESERRYHPLARHCDILTSIETRISMLNMTYSKFIDTGICCFIPGKVIDEIRRVLLIAETQKSPPRAHEVLQELRDISSMAIEHFDDKISPALRQRLRAGDDPPPQRTQHQHAVFAPLAMRQEVLSLRRRSILNAKLSLYLATQYKKYHKRMLEYRKIAIRQRTLVRDLTRKQKAQDAAIAELKKRIEECDVRYSELTHTNQAVGVKVKAAVGSASPPAQPLRHFGSQIKLDLSVLPIGTSKRTHNALLPNMKPRMPVIKLPSLSADEPPRAKLEPRAGPSTNRGPVARAQSSLAKIRGITSEIRHLTNLSKNIESKLKRTATCVDDGLDAKKQKVD
ncbi:hypothetical protein MSG28_015789 [Choristoneura fumiferana]|uniref:Uncharacterized protein n=1 Tax=Choristoneura fumiferana TaxID=7141 RepID=A0ACC0KBC7_CHOFU|nr:hypothetical protein MSG28_015789 [Choristoneura fumiferana]